MLKYCEKFQISLKISREFLSGNCQYWSNLRAPPTASLFCFGQFVFKVIFSRIVSVFVSYCYNLVPASRPALRPTQPRIQWVPGVLSPGAKHGRGVTLTTHPHLVPRLSMSRSCTSSPPCASRACSGTALFTSLLLYLQCCLTGGDRRRALCQINFLDNNLSSD
jgi:hypothetical protein